MTDASGDTCGGFPLQYVPPSTLNHVHHVLSNLARPLPVNPFSFLPPATSLPLKLMGSGCLYPWGNLGGLPPVDQRQMEFENRLNPMSFPLQQDLQSPHNSDICKGNFLL